tara:strand:- start:4772 stop:7396 length:2625 start_codon:yes stop_codon:yes gene_type:complete
MTAPTDRQQPAGASDGGAAIPLDFLTDMADAETLDALLQAAALWLPRIFEADRFGIALRNDEHTLRLAALSGGQVHHRDELWPIEGTRLGVCFKSQKTIATPDTERPDWAAAHVTQHAVHKYRSVVILPLVAAETCIGTLNFGWYPPHAYRPDIVGDLEKVAKWIASRINHHEIKHNLEVSEARFNALIENTDSQIFAKSADGRMLIANESFCRSRGLARADVIGRLDSDLFGAEVSSTWHIGDRRVIESGAAETIEENLLHADGTLHPHITQKFPVFDPDRNEYIICGISTDISERIRAEQALTDSERRSQAFFDNSPSAMFMKDLNHTIVFANKEFLEFFGRTPDETLGAQSASYIDPENLKKFDQADKECIELGEKRQVEAQMVDRHGETHDFLVTKFPVYDGDGAIIGVGGVNTNVTDLRQSEMQLRIARDEAEMAAIMYKQAADKARAADLAKSEFLASMSHELRTPLNGVLGMANILLDSELDADQAQKIETIRASGQSLLMILNDILDLSKIEADELDLECRDFSLAALIAGIDDMWQPQAAAKGLAWDWNVDDSLAPVLFSDSARLRQILFNLVSNALKFTETGGISLSVTQSERTDGDIENTFEITDTGPGIPDGMEEKLFEKFTQADSSITRRYGGTGLGLAICKSLVERMGGTIHFDSAPGHGTTFRFSIVCPAGSAAKLPAEASGPDPLDAAPPTKSLRVLVAEDNTVNQQVIQLMLLRAGHRCDLAGNGIEALAAVRNHPYDLVLMDIQMPEMDGVTATRRIRAIGGAFKTLPIIALTANAMKGDRERFIDAGMNDYVPKPIEIAQFNAAIARQTAVHGGLTAPMGQAAVPDGDGNGDGDEDGGGLATEIDSLFDGLDLPA